MSPGRTPIWPHSEVEEARAMREADPKKWTHKALADWFGCHPATMTRWLIYQSRVGGKLYGDRA